MQSRSPTFSKGNNITAPSNANATFSTGFSNSVIWKKFLEKRHQRRRSSIGSNVSFSGLSRAGSNISFSGLSRAGSNISFSGLGKEAETPRSNSTQGRSDTHDGIPISNTDYLESLKDVTDQRKVTAEFKYQLLMLWQATRCQKAGHTHFHHHDKDCNLKPESPPSGFAPQSCVEVQILSKHISTCRNGKDCDVPHCVSSRYILGHHRNCRDLKCAVCVPVRKLMRGIKRKERVERKILTGLHEEFDEQYCSEYGMPRS